MKGKLSLVTRLLAFARIQADRLGTGALVVHRGALVEDNMRALGATETAYRLRACLAEDDIRCVIDVGANDGRFGVGLRELGFRGEICSFEPNPDEFARVNAAATADGAWRAEQLAMGSERGELVLHLTHTSQFASIRKGAPLEGQFTADLAVVRDVRVPVERLDSYLATTRPDIVPERTLLKVDTQGFDHQVLLGAGALLERFPAVLFELPLIPIYEEVEPYTATLALLNAAGLGVSHVTTVSRTPDQRLVIESDVLMRRARSKGQAARS